MSVRNQLCVGSTASGVGSTATGVAGKLVEAPNFWRLVVNFAIGRVGRMPGSHRDLIAGIAWQHCLAAGTQ